MCVDVQTVLSAVIMCGPPSVHLDKPVVLSFPHCASVKHGHWSLSLFTSHSRFDQPPAWHVRHPLTYLLLFVDLSLHVDYKAEAEDCKGDQTWF